MHFLHSIRHQCSRLRLKSVADYSHYNYIHHQLRRHYATSKEQQHRINVWDNVVSTEKPCTKISMECASRVNASSLKPNHITRIKHLVNRATNKVKRAYVAIIDDGVSKRPVDMFTNVKGMTSAEVDMANRENKKHIIKATLVDYTNGGDEAKMVFWNSASKIVCLAMENLFGDSVVLANVDISKDGFRIDADFSNDYRIKADDLLKLSEEVTRIVGENLPFMRLSVPVGVAKTMFSYNKYKVLLVDERIASGHERINLFRLGNFIDICDGPHIPKSGLVSCLELLESSGVYWQNDKRQKQLQRVHGIAFPSSNTKDAWIETRKEAQERDHRFIGKNQKLFFHSDMSPGCTFFLPHGQRIISALSNYLREEYRRRGFDEISTPIMFSDELWKRSGHWDHYHSDMYYLEDAKETKDGPHNKNEKGHSKGLKPMNCPAHCLVYDHMQPSLNELPIRLADFGPLHRNELKGALTGLTRVRLFHQDDGHIFCTENQIQAEVKDTLDFIHTVYKAFGFEEILYVLSTRPTKSFGDSALWSRAEACLKDSLDEHVNSNSVKSWGLNPGDGAFYGPKIDVSVRDYNGRSHQTATIQLDFQLPLRFNLDYVGADGNRHTPVIIHRAVLGSFERMLAILTESTGGKWPLWLSPRQCIVLPISQVFDDYGRHVYDEIKKSGFHVDGEFSSNRTLPRKIREARLQAYNYIVVVGEKERSRSAVNILTRNGERLGVFSIVDFLSKLRLDVSEKIAAPEVISKQNLQRNA